jgi:hypothetical protein
MAEINDPEDFYILARMAAWCAHPQEYRITPDAIEIWAKEEIYWPPSEEKMQVYLIKYRYNNYNWEGKVGDFEHVGYCLPGGDPLFSIMESFDDIYEAYAAYSAFDSGGSISQEKSLELIKKYL